MLTNIRIVLVGTTHPGNIGAVARAMKNMSLEKLYLVAPKIFPSADATARASGADDLLCAAKVCPTLREAIADCQIVIGASARSRTIGWPEVSARECAEKLAVDAKNLQAAIVFGRENSGLTNEEMDLCECLLKIPCNPRFSSLNLASAVQVVAYELFIACRDAADAAVVSSEPLASSEQMESFYSHLNRTLHDIGFMRTGQTRTVMRRLRKLYNRAQLNTKELDMLRGILRMSQGYRRE
ncbi:MAG: RNA methyltransferase [Gammaproteobacteria bacterium]